MVDIIKERLRQKSRTGGYPRGAVTLPEKYRGLPKINPGACVACGDKTCLERCPTDALTFGGGSDATLSLDLGRCIFCAECASACKNKAISFTNDFRLSARNRRDLTISGNELALVKQLDKKMRALFGRSLKLREVSAGGCNACEADTNVLSTLFFDLRPFRHSIRGLTPPCRRPFYHRTRDGEHGAGPEKDLCRNPRTKARHRRRGLRRFRRIIQGPSGNTQWSGFHTPGRSLHSGMPAASAHDPRRTLEAFGKIVAN